MKASIKWLEDFCEDSDTRTVAERALDEAVIESFKQQRESVELEIKSLAAECSNLGLLFGCSCIVKPLALKVKL